MEPLYLNLSRGARRAGILALNAPTSGPAHSPVFPLFLPASALAKSHPGTWEGRLLLSRLSWPSDSSQQSVVSCSPFIYPGGRRPLFWIPGLGSQPHRTQSPQLQPSPMAHERREKTDGFSEKSHPHYLGSKGQNLCSDRGGQENGEFQCYLSLAADFTAEFGPVTATGRMPQEAWAAFPRLTTAPAQNRHRRVQALALMLTCVFLSLTLKLISSSSSHPRASLDPPSSSPIPPWAWPSGPFVNETRHFSTLFDPGFNEHSPPQLAPGPGEPAPPPGWVPGKDAEGSFHLRMSPGSQTLSGIP